MLLCDEYKYSKRKVQGYYQQNVLSPLIGWTVLHFVYIFLPIRLYVFLAAITMFLAHGERKEGSILKGFAPKPVDPFERTCK